MGLGAVAPRPNSHESHNMPHAILRSRLNPESAMDDKTVLEEVTDAIKGPGSDVVEGAKAIADPAFGTPVQVPLNESGADIRKAAKKRKMPAPKKQARQVPKRAAKAAPKKAAKRTRAKKATKKKTGRKRR
jgi:hypothetical protein